MTTTEAVAEEETAGEPILDKSGRRVRRMFATIARRYDFLNHLLSLNIDRSWRAFATKAVPPEPGVPILDCCTGTADLAIAYDQAAKGASPIVGADFCRPMLEIGRRKIDKANAGRRIVLVEGDALALPAADDSFGIVCVAFGLRNVADTNRGIDEMIRVARPGGKVAILEFSKPTVPLLGSFYLFFFKHLLPRIGQAIAPNKDDAYRYLPRSVLRFPDGPAMVSLLSSRGLVDPRAYRLSLGAATLYVGTKPSFANEARGRA